MQFLAIESSCDETSVAIFTDDLRILANVVASQIDLHARFGGVVPEVAARAHLQRLLPTMDEALRQARLKPDDISAVVVMNSPGLVGALLVGVRAAKMLALTLDVPLLSANHIEAHIYACRLAAGRDIFPCVGLVVSGGHTSLFHCRDALDFELLGATLDDAAGEAFDKVASILDLGFPGGPAIEREAQAGNPLAHAFPRSFLHDDRLDFSFSGLKTAVLYAVHPPTPPLAKGGSGGVAKGPPPPPGPGRTDLAASFQQAVVVVLVAKARQALEQTGLKRLAVGGGVCANQCLRRHLEKMAAEMNAELFMPPLDLCTDNAAMAAIAVEKWQRGQWAALDLDAVPAYRNHNQ